ncbi:hypothetical protein FRB96_007553 [Tulasnella sp. 330]|nr:hypothetical protein FRB96_007553 [Tulasnella sp. 330]KAG8887973.1 hypothetical protein FRB98_008646 [Tulasnella sp. 332]
MDDVCLIAAPRPLRLFNPSSSATIHHHNNNSPHRVVVPRTRPIFSPVEAFAKFSLEDSPSSAIDEDALEEPDSSMSSSPDDSNTRLSLPDETLEEFLAILRPPTNLPPFRFNHHHHHRRQVLGSSSSSSYPYERPHPYRFRKSVSTISSAATEETDRTSRSKRGVEGREKLSMSIGQRSDVDTPLTTTSVDEAVAQTEWRNFELGKGKFQIIQGGDHMGLNDKTFLSIGSPISRNQTRNPLPRHPSYEALTANLFVSVSVVTTATSPVSPLLRPTRNIIDNLHHHSHSSSSHILPVSNTTSTEETVMPSSSSSLAQGQ